MNDILQEVQDDIRYDKNVELWHKYKHLAYGIVAVIVLGTVGTVGYKNYATNSYENLSTQFFEANQLAGEQKLKEAYKQFETIAAESKNSYGALARLQQAHILVKQNKHDEAIKRFQSLSKDSSLPKAFRDLASFQTIALAGDSLSPDVILHQLDELLVKNSPWQSSIMEYKAMIHLKINELEEAKQIWQQLTTQENVPASIRSRSQTLMDASSTLAALKR